MPRKEAGGGVYVFDEQGLDGAVRGEGASSVTTSAAADRAFALLAAVGERIFALPLAHVIETMRPLPVERIAGAPGYVRGLTIIRGSPLPVVSMRALFGGMDDVPDDQRFVTVRSESRTFALALTRVIGVRDIRSLRLQELPPLLQHADSEAVAAIGVADAQLLTVLRAARIVPEAVWPTLDAATEVR